MRGLGIGKNEMACRWNAKKSEIEEILVGGANDDLISAMAKELDLMLELLSLARKDWYPAPLTINGRGNLTCHSGR